jgi:amino acid adenylation domain-containing protein
LRPPAFRLLSSIVDLLLLRASEAPDNKDYTFLVDGEVAAARLTFGELDRRARAVGALLGRSGARRERTLLLFPPGLDFIAAFFGCLYGGSVAVPAYPPQAARGQPRLRSIVRDARPRVVLTTALLAAHAEELVSQIPELAGAVWLRMDEIPPSFAEGWEPPALGPEDLAFLQYTSGSTAAPKGVMVSHGNLLHNEETIRLAFEQDEESVVVSWLPLYHDMGLIGSVLQPLYVGARCILMSPLAFLQRPLRWLAAISAYRGTTSGGPNFAYDLAVRKIAAEDRRGLDLSSWRVAFNGAEPVRADTLERFAAAFAPCGFDRRAFFPCYGLAEATLFVTGGPRGGAPVLASVEPAALERGQAIVSADVPPVPRRLVGCGGVWPGHTLRIVDAESAIPCPADRVGEIWVAGPSVAAGYWGLAEEAGRTFGASTASGDGPYLRTGDLGFLHGDELFVTGRAKDLIILRGRNLYPQDLELTAERSHPALRPGCGAAFAVEVGDEERLVVVHELERGAERDAAAAATAIRQALAAEHEVQAYDVVLLRHDTIPKTTSGKVQRQACRQRYLAADLEALDRSRVEEAEPGEETAGAASLAPELWRELAPERRGPWLESYLGEALARLFRLPAAVLDPEQPLSRFGLDSLAAVELQQTLARDLAVIVELGELLAGPTLRELARELADRGVDRAATTRIPLAPMPESAAGSPLTHNQRALWFLQRLQPESTAYHVVAAAEVEPALELAPLRRALELLAGRHEALRLRFVESESGPLQRAAVGREIELSEEDATGWSAARLEAHLHAVADRPFDLERDPLLRIAVFHGDPQVVLLVAHHIVVDLWSLVVLVRELGDLYSRLSRGEVEPVAGAPALRYSDFAAWQRQLLAGEAGEAHWAYWRGELAGELPVLRLPTDRPRPHLQTFRGGARAHHLNSGLLDGVRALARLHHTTPFTALLAALAALLYRHGAGEDLLVGSPMSGRGAAELSELVGLFVNSVVLRSRVAGDLPFAALLGRVRETALAAFAHQDYPFPLLVERLRPARDPGRSPIFQVMLSHESSPAAGGEELAAFALGEAGARAEVAGLSLASRRLEHRAAQFDLELIAAESRRGLGLTLVYNADLFDPTTAERLLERFTILLRGAFAEPRQRISDLPLLGGPERQQLVVDWNDTDAPVGLERCFHERFEEQVRRAPDAVAVSCEDREMTYAELDATANRLARGLLAAGLAPEGRVAFWLERGVDFLAAMIAVLKAGGAYLPLDPRQPTGRLKQIALASGSGLVLASPSSHELATAAFAGEDGAPSVLSLGRLLDADRSSAALAWGPRPCQLAYVLFTSGSTGAPKGVMIEHRSLLNHLLSKTVQPPLASDDRVAQTAAASFDISVWQFLSALLVGGSVHILPDEAVGDPPRLLAEISRRRITVVETVPSLLSALVQESEAGPPLDLSALRWLIPTGEALPPDLCRRWLVRFPHAPLLNAYGPTECGDDVSTQEIRAPLPEGTARTPIGRPIANLRLHALDRDLGLAPLGAPGELAVAGAGVGRGYLADPARTAAAFIPDPYGPTPGGRLYRTGDLVLRRQDGRLELLGRLDDQVKLRGFRVEPGEIEAALAAHPGIAQATVLARRDGRGDQRLVAYWTAAAELTPTPGEIRQLLRQSLPAAMIPSLFVRLPAMPLTASGKIDRRALPEPDEAGAPDRPGLAARDEMEELLVSLFARILGRERVRADDDFFALGGHSLLATQAIARLRRELGIELTLQDFFAEPTPAALAARASALLRAGERGAMPPLAPRARGADPPLSFGQRRLWFLHQLEPESPAYNMPGTVRLRGRVRIEALAASLALIVARHESLRTVFHAVAGEPSQQILAEVEVALPLVDLGGLPAARRTGYAHEIAVAESRRPFELSRWPLFRTALLRLRDGDHLLLVTLHHIVADGWSQAVLVREMSAFYNAFSQAVAPHPPALAVQYADFARWQIDWLRGELLEAQLAYWRRQLGGEPPALELPLDRPRPPRRTYRGGRRALHVPAMPTGELMRLARREGVTPFMSLLALFAACLERHGGQAQVHIGSPIANRRLPELEELIGFFANTLVLRVDLAAATSLQSLLGPVRRTALEAYAHQDIPFERLVDELSPSRDLARSPLFQTMLVLQNAPAPRLELAGLSLDLAELDNGTAKFELTLSLEEVDGGLSGWIEYDSDLFDTTTAERFSARFRSLLAAAAASPGAPLSLLPLLGEAERSQLLIEWNDSRSDEPAEPFVHRLFATCARRVPEAVAISAAEGDLTYRELDARANGLARTLRTSRIAADVPVGILAERSLSMVVGMLGVLAAGGAYLPLDPRYPRERLVRMIADSGAPLVIAEEHLAGMLEGVAATVVPLRTAAGEAVPDTPLWPESLAYVLFTSGSTGRPKGVQVTHRGFASLLASLAREPLALGGRTLLSVTTLAFDIAGLEIFLPLTTGGRVVLADHDEVLDGTRLAAALERAQATLLQATPTTWRLLVESGWQGGEGLVAITGGEALSRDLAERVRARVAVLWNGYGPTETTIYSSFHRVGGEAGGIPIGRPAADTAVHLLDRSLAPVPIGVVGEIHIGGRGLARGYIGRPDLTAERFGPDPVGSEPGARLYRTGDLGRRSPDGRIEYLGRIDHQVKLRGFRIELPEIEAVLESHPEVEQAVVTVGAGGPRPGAPSGERRLIAYFVASGAAAPDPGELRSFLRRHLPEYMVPALLVRLASLPLTPNGKVDRQALPPPEATGEEARPATSPRDADEEIVAGIFAQVLGREQVASEDDFFALGGHSLLATQVVSRLKAALGVDLPLRALFETPTAAGLARAAAVSRHRPARPPLERLSHDRPLALSFAQERLWVMNQVAPGSPVYNVFQALRLAGPLAAEVLERSLVEVIRRHEVLRTRFKTLQGRPVQIVSPTPHLALARLDLAGIAPAAAEREAMRLAHEEARRPFELDWEPPIRAALLLLGEERRALLLAMHHIACDDWSIGLLVREVAALYGAFRAGLPSPLPELLFQYADYARWQREWLQGEVLEEGLAAWRRLLGDAPPLLELPTDRSRPPRRTFRGTSEPFSLPAPLVNALRRLGRREGATLFMVLLAGWASVLGKIAEQDDVVVGAAVAGRIRPEIEPLIGFFVNLLPLRIDLAGDPTYAELLARARGVALAAFDHQEIPFEKVVESLGLRRDPARAPLHQVALTMQETAMQPVALGEGILAEPMDVDSGVSRLDLTLFVWASGDGLAGACEYDTEIFDRATISRLLDAFQLVLADVATDAGHRPLALPLPSGRAGPRVAEGDLARETNLTQAQLLFWFASKLQPEVQLYFDRATTTFTMSGDLDERHFARAFRRLVEGCDALRTRVVEIGGVPQRIVGETCPDPLEQADLSTAGDPGAAFRAWLLERSPRAIDLAARPFDAALVRLGPRRFVWFFNVHHIVVDAGSLQAIARRLSLLYRLSLADRLDAAAPLPSFEEYAAEERRSRATERYQRARLYWEWKLAQPAGANPFYRPPGRPFTTRTARRSFDLGVAASDRVREQSSRSDLFSPAVLFTGALFALLYRLHGEHRLRVGTSFYNRPQRFREVVGLLMNTCPLQVEVEPSETFRSLLKRVQSEMIETARTTSTSTTRRWRTRSSAGSPCASISSARSTRTTT